MSTTMLQVGSVMGRSRADGRGHGLFDEKHLPGAGGFGRFAHRPLFHLGDARRHSDDDARPDEGSPVVHLVDEVAQHGLGHFEIGNDTVAHGPDGHDIARGAAEHVLGFQSHGQHTVFRSVVRSHGDHGGFAENDALAFDINQGVGRSQVNGQIAGKDTQYGIDEIHAASFWFESNHRRSSLRLQAPVNEPPFLQPGGFIERVPETR
jgi:hypothetical protein